MNPHNSFTFFKEKETAEAFSSLIPPLNNIILEYLEGLPPWCFIGNKINFTHPHPGTIVNPGYQIYQPYTITITIQTISLRGDRQIYLDDIRGFFTPILISAVGFANPFVLEWIQNCSSIP